MKRSSRLEQKRILRSIEEEKQRAVEVKNGLEKERIKEEKRKKKEQLVSEREEVKRKKRKLELETDVAGACASNIDCGSEKSEKQQQPVRKKKLIHKLKFKPKAQREEIDISNTTIEVITATAAHIRKTKKDNTNATSKAHSRNLVYVPSQKERSIIYEETAKAIAIKECQALPPYGGRPWKCIITISDDFGASGAASSLKGEVINQQADLTKKKDKKNKKKKAPLFRWFRGKLELACLPHILEQIDVVDINHGLLKSVKDEYDMALKCMKEDEKPTDLVVRQASIISTVAWNDEDYSIPKIDRKWISPNHITIKSRSKAFEHCSMLDERDKTIDKILHGIGLRGANIRPVKPTRKQALEAGNYRFLRDGLWVIGQEEEWIKDRIEEFNAEVEKEGDGVEINGKAGTNEGKSNDKEEGASSDVYSKNMSTQEQYLTCDEEKKDEEIIEKKLISCKRKREHHFVPSQHWRLTEDQIRLCTDAIMEFYEKVSNTIKARALHSELADGFDVFRQRGYGRYDMQLPEFETEKFSFLTDLQKAAWMPVVKKILGDDATIVHKGAFLSMPGSATQIYHQDGVHLTTKYQRPCHAINVFIPLVQLEMKNGPTEFCVGTHMLGYEYYSREMIDTPLPPAGSPVIFDYRLGHRGLGNSSSQPRPIIYLTYTSASKEFRDSVNFSQKRYRKLGELVEKPLSREERALKRANI